MVNKYGKKETLEECHVNGKVSYLFGVYGSGYCFERTYDENENELTYRNSKGESRGFDKPKGEAKTENISELEQLKKIVTEKTIILLNSGLKGRDYAELRNKIDFGIKAINAITNNK